MFNERNVVDGFKIYPYTILFTLFTDSIKMFDEFEFEEDGLPQSESRHRDVVPPVQNKEQKQRKRTRGKSNTSDDDDASPPSKKIRYAPGE